MTDPLHTLNDLLQGPGRPGGVFSDRHSHEMTPTERASHFPPPVGTIDTSAGEKAGGEASEKAIQIGAEIMVEQPWRIGRAIYGIGFRIGDWDKPHLVMLLAKCRAAIEGEVKRAQEGHWTADHNRLVALRQAERALATKIKRGDYR